MNLTLYLHGVIVGYCKYIKTILKCAQKPQLCHVYHILVKHNFGDYTDTLTLYYYGHRVL